MPPSIDDHAARFDEKATGYDGDRGPEYEAALHHVVAAADPSSGDVVVDIGTGTGAVALALAPAAGAVYGRDISEGMLEEASRKADERDVASVTFAVGRFREPNLPAGTAVDVVTSNFAMHHLTDDEKREAIEVIAGLEPRRIVLGDVMFFEGPDPTEPFFSPDVDDPATVGVLADAFTDAGYALTGVERIHDQVGVLVAEPAPASSGGATQDGSGTTEVPPEGPP